MAVFYSDNYRDIFKQSLLRFRGRGEKRTLTDLAAAIRVQRPYLSKVIHGHADLNADQMYLACRYLEFSTEETAYLQLLLDHSRAGLRDRKAALAGQIRETRKKHLDIKKHLKAESVTATAADLTEYYTDPHAQLVHIALTIPRFQKEPSLLGMELRIEPERLKAVLTILERIRFIEFRSGRYHVLREHIHLPKDSPLLGAHQTLSRLSALERLRAGAQESAYTFSVTFSADERSRNAIQQEFLAFLKRVETIAKDAPAEELYQLNFDLFEWTKATR